MITPLPPLWTYRARILALYRSTLREAKKLPHDYLREFFRARTRERFHSAKDVVKPEQLYARMKGLKVDHRRLVAANRGEHAAVQRMLGLAFGRRGKLRHELMKPVVFNASLERSASNSTKKAPITYTPRLSALLTSQLARSQRPLRTPELEFPPTLPAHAKPTSDDAKLLGRLSIRRERNIRWKYFKQEVAKIYPPLVTVEQGGKVAGTPVGVQLFSILEKMAGRPEVGQPRRESRANKASQRYPVGSAGGRKSRYLRRRFAEILGQAPVLRQDARGKFTVTLSDNALKKRERSGSALGKPTQEDIEWIERAERSK